MWLEISIKICSRTKSFAVFRQFEVILNSRKCLHTNLWRSPCNQCRCAVTTMAFMLTLFLPSLNRIWHSFCLGLDKTEANIFGFTLGCTGSGLLCTNKAMMQEKCQHSSAPAELPLCSSGPWRTHSRQGDSAGLSNVPSPHSLTCAWQLCFDSAGISAERPGECTNLGPALAWVYLEESSVTDTRSSFFEHSHIKSWNHNLSTVHWRSAGLMTSLLISRAYSYQSINAAARGWPFWLPH